MWDGCLRNTIHHGDFCEENSSTLEALHEFAQLIVAAAGWRASRELAIHRDAARQSSA